MRKLFASCSHFKGFVFQTFPTEKQERQAQYVMLVISFYAIKIVCLTTAKIYKNNEKSKSSLKLYHQTIGLLTKNVITRVVNN